MVETVVLDDAPEVNFRVWINETNNPQYSTAYFLLKPATYSVRVDSGLKLQDPWDPTKFYVYTFNRWEDNSNENPRTLSLNTDKTITAYYKVKVIYIQSSLDNEVP